MHMVVIDFVPEESGVTAWVSSDGPLAPGSYAISVVTLLTYEFPAGNSLGLFSFIVCFR